jgi:4'-phosphopantetheinyl transferase
VLHVDVWTIRLDEEPFDVADADAVLDAEERTRASRFVFDRDRRRFVRRRLALRRLLGRYSDLPPERLQFGKGENGKPFLAFPDGTSITFSASHANELALVAVTHGCCIGVDVEWIGRTVEWYSVSRMFAAGERARLRQLSGDELRFAGFRCWTRKEAFVKGRGDGLSLPLQLFEVNVDEGEPPRLVSVAPEIDDGRDWTLTEVEVPPEYIACLASTSGEPHIQLHDGTKALSS